MRCRGRRQQLASWHELVGAECIVFACFLGTLGCVAATSGSVNCVFKQVVELLQQLT